MNLHRLHGFGNEQKLSSKEAFMIDYCDNIFFTFGIHKWFAHFMNRAHSLSHGKKYMGK